MPRRPANDPGARAGSVAADGAAAASPTDEQVMERVRATGDPRAFALLMERWEASIRRLCLRMMAGDAALAEDFVQETFARVYEKRALWRPTARFSTYLWRVAVNLCTSHLRKRARRGDRVLEADESHGRLHGASSDDATPSAAAAAREEAELVRRAIEALPAPYRAVLVLRHYEGLKRREIAEVLEIPEGTVSSRLVEAMERLTAALEPLFPDAERGREGGRPRPAGESRACLLRPARETS